MLAIVTMFISIFIGVFVLYQLTTHRSKSKSIRNALKVSPVSAATNIQEDQHPIAPFIFFNSLRIDKTFTIEKGSRIEKNFYIVDGTVEILLDGSVIGVLGRNQITHNAFDLMAIETEITKRAATDVLVCEMPSNTSKYVNMKILEKTCFDPMLRFCKNYPLIAALENIKVQDFEKFVADEFELRNYKIERTIVEGKVTLSDCVYNVVSGCLVVNGAVLGKGSVFGYFGAFFNHYKGFDVTASGSTILEYVPYSKLRGAYINKKYLRKLPKSMLYLVATAEWTRIPYGQCIFKKGLKCTDVFLVDGIEYCCKECILNTPHESDLIAEKTLDLIRIPKKTIEVLLREMPGLYEEITTRMFEKTKAQSKVVLITPALMKCEMFIQRLRKTLSNEIIIVKNTNISEILGKNVFNNVGELAVSEYLNGLRESYRVVAVYLENDYSRMLKLIHPYCDVIFIVGADIVQNHFDRKNVEFVKLYEQRKSIERVRSKIKKALISGFFRDMSSEDSESGEDVKIDPLEENVQQRHPVFRRIHRVLCPKDMNFSNKDFERLARYLLGERYGLVLGGGGARGFAHIGVIKALEEENIPVDVIGGTSMGAFVGALYSRELDYAEVYTLCKRMAKSGSSLINYFTDLTYPYVSLLSGRSFDKQMKNIFKKQKIQDFWLEYYCVTTDLKSLDQAVHFNGSAFKYIRASMSVAGLLPPVFYKNSILCDGAYTNNIPVDVMESLDVKNIITVRVCRDFDVNVCNHDSTSGIVLLFKSLILSKPYLSITETQYRLSFLSSIKKFENLNSQSFLIVPDLAAYKTLDFHKFDEIVACGYQTAKKKIKEWKSAGLIKDFKMQTRRFSI